MTRILLLLQHRENRNLLANWLSMRYQVIVPDSTQSLDHSFDLCILDGPSLHRLGAWVRARKEKEQPVFLPFLLVTSRQDLGVGTRYLWQSIDELIISPIEKTELQARIELLLRVRRLSLVLQQQNEELEISRQELARKNEELEKAYSRIKKDLEAAARMQRSLLPQTAITLSGVKFDWVFSPSAFVAGDIFNFFSLDNEHLGFYHLDVSGHGIPSAMLSVTLSKVLSPDPHQESPLRRRTAHPPYTEEITPPAAVIAELNRRFQNGGENMTYFTMIYGILHTTTGRVTFTQAGHPSPVYLPRGAKATLIGHGGFPVGMLPDIEYDSLDLVLHPGDRLFLYSDGITECLNKESKQFGEKRLMSFLEESAGLSLHDLMQLLEQQLRLWKGDDAFEDDISLFALEMV